MFSGGKPTDPSGLRAYLIICLGIVLGLTLIGLAFPRQQPRQVVIQGDPLLPRTGGRPDSSAPEPAPASTLSVSGIVADNRQPLENCTYDSLYWENDPDAWVAENVLIGEFSFTRAEIQEILDRDSDLVADQLLKQFLVAVLNILNGADPSQVENHLIQASAWIDSHPPGIELSVAERRVGEELAVALAEFNRGLTGPGLCPDNPSTLTPTPTPSATVSRTPIYSGAFQTGGKTSTAAAGTVQGLPAETLGLPTASPVSGSSTTLPASSTTTVSPGPANTTSTPGSTPTASETATAESAIQIPSRTPNPTRLVPPSPTPQPPGSTIIAPTRTRRPSSTPRPTSTPRPATSTPRPTNTDPPPTRTPRPTSTRPPATSTPRPTNTEPPPTSTPRPTNTQPPATSTPRPTNTQPPATNTPRPTETAQPATNTPQPTSTPEPATDIPEPTDPPEPSPTDTPEPPPTDTPAPPPTDPPEPTPTDSPEPPPTDTPEPPPTDTPEPPPTDTPEPPPPPSDTPQPPPEDTPPPLPSGTP